MGKYDDIIDLPHPEPQTHPRMSMHARAAQLPPFAALHGHHEAMIEAERLTDRHIELLESPERDSFICMWKRALLDRKVVKTARPRFAEPYSSTGRTRREQYRFASISRPV